MQENEPRFRQAEEVLHRSPLMSTLIRHIPFLIFFVCVLRCLQRLTALCLIYPGFVLKRPGRKDVERKSHFGQLKEGQGRPDRQFRVVLAVILAVVLILFRFLGQDLFTVDNIRANRDFLLALVHDHYFLAVFLFIGAYISTAFAVPGALVLALVGGFLFGAFRGALYANIGLTAGAILAFLTARFVLGEWLQKRYSSQLEAFNREIEGHGAYYLFVLRVVPALPFFLVNYLAGITRMSLKSYVIATGLGELPGSVILSFAGQQFQTISHMEDALTPTVLFSLGLVALLGILPVIINRAWKAH